MANLRAPLRVLDRAGAVALAWSVLLGCDGGDGEVVPAGSAVPGSASSRLPADRLAPGELEPGKQVVFGFRAPQIMRVEAVFPKAAHLRGSASPEELANYVRARVAAQHVEIAATRTVFPRARIKGDHKGDIYRLEIIPDRGETRLVIRNVTPPPTVQGIDEKERWKRAGMSPDGKLLNRQQLE